MSELRDPLQSARDHIDVPFDERAIERGLSGLSRRIVRRRRIVQSGAALSVLTALCLVWIELHGRTPLATMPLVPLAVRTADGSIATGLQPETSLRLERDTQAEVALSLVRGKSHFEVTRKPQRRYRVRAGRVEVQVLGTGFDVERRGEQTFVRVDHGLVKVSWSDGSVLLHAGEQGLYPPTPAVVSAPVVPREPTLSAEEPAPDDAAEAGGEPPPDAVNPRAAGKDTWRRLARAGKHREAFGTLGKKPVVDLEGLLLAADAARLSGHPREAVGYLQRLVQRYPKSAPARLAAFTLGRLALNELNEPALAARSFARAYTLDPSGPLAEDALAREAEAYHRAGDAERAKSAAQRYLQRFPAGARRQELARYLQ